MADSKYGKLATWSICVLSLALAFVVGLRAGRASCRWVQQDLGAALDAARAERAVLAEIAAKLSYEAERPQLEEILKAVPGGDCDWDKLMAMRWCLLNHIAP